MVFSCPTCSEDFEDSRSLGHNWRVHPYCPECDRCYACFPKGEFVGHKCKVPGPVMCEDCFKVYASVKDLKLHLSQSGHMCKFECGDCGEPRPTLDSSSFIVRDHKADFNLPDAFRESTSYACFAAARNAALAAVGLDRILARFDSSIAFGRLDFC